MFQKRQCVGVSNIRRNPRVGDEPFRQVPETGTLDETFRIRSVGRTFEEGKEPFCAAFDRGPRRFPGANAFRAENVTEQIDNFAQRNVSQTSARRGKRPQFLLERRAGNGVSFLETDNAVHTENRMRGHLDRIAPSRRLQNAVRRRMGKRKRMDRFPVDGRENGRFAEIRVEHARSQSPFLPHLRFPAPEVQHETACGIGMEFDAGGDFRRSRRPIDEQLSLIWIVLVGGLPQFRNRLDSLASHSNPEQKIGGRSTPRSDQIERRRSRFDGKDVGRDVGFAGPPDRAELPSRRTVVREKNDIAHESRVLVRGGLLRAINGGRVRGGRHEFLIIRPAFRFILVGNPNCVTDVSLPFKRNGRFGSRSGGRGRKNLDILQSAEKELGGQVVVGKHRHREGDSCAWLQVRGAGVVRAAEYIELELARN